MNRQFHAKTPIGNYVLLAVLLSVAFYFLWQGISKPVLGIILCILFMFMLIIIERMIHTCYTITGDGKLIIDKGRLAKVVVLEVADIEKVDKIRNSSLVIVMKDGTEHFIQPKNEADFIKYLKHKHEQNQTEVYEDEED